MLIGYIVNRYPAVSHAFIRREILALESQGYTVHRFSVRGWDEDVTDAEDLEERSKTRYLLQAGLLALIGPSLRWAVRQPARWCEALRATIMLFARSGRRAPIHLAYLGEAARLAEWLREAGVTHLHAHFGTNSTDVAMLASRLAGIPFSFTVHGPEEFDKPEALGLPEKMRAAAFVVGVSSFGRSQLLRWSPHARWGDVTVVRCGVDAGFLAAAPVPVPAAPRLVCIGRLCEQKGQLLLVAAAARILEGGQPLELVLVGDGPMRSEIERLCAQLGLSTHVRFTGWASGAAVRGEILASRALVLPSFAEGLPVVLMESLALGRPVITTAVAGIPELVVDGENGWLVPAGDVDALQSAMLAALRAPASDLEEMGRRGRGRVAARHDAMTEAARLADLIGMHR